MSGTTRIGLGVPIAVALFSCTSQPPEATEGEESESVLPFGDIEAERQDLLNSLGGRDFPQPYSVCEMAGALFEQPLESQSDEALAQLARDANVAANLVDYLLAEYADHYRDNYEYDFVQRSVRPFQYAYQHLFNELVRIRNQSYFNLGTKAVGRGEQFRGFFHFRDAYRLSGFSEPAGDHKGLRYLAEIEMKKILGIQDVDTWVYWDSSFEVTERPLPGVECRPASDE